MIKKTITFETFDGETVTEEFYFHIARHELVDFQLGAPGGDFEAYVRQLMTEKNSAKIVEVFKKFVTVSYGRRNSEGGFEKDPMWTRAFLGSNAFDEMVMEFFTNPSKANEFIQGILPQKLVNEAKSKGLLVDEQLPNDLAGLHAATPLVVNEVEDDQPAYIREGRLPTKKELMDMTPEQIARAMGMKVGAEKIRKEE